MNDEFHTDLPLFLTSSEEHSGLGKMTVCALSTHKPFLATAVDK